MQSTIFFCLLVSQGSCLMLPQPLYRFGKSKLVIQNPKKLGITLCSSDSNDLSGNLVAANFHFTRVCNYACKFCFHTSKTSHMEDMTNLFTILGELKRKGCKKINFAGGEPFLFPEVLGEMIKFSKEKLEFESVSVISNASKITEDWMRKYAKYLDILGVSCDSCLVETNKKIGRGSGLHIELVRKAAELCKVYNVKFKLNTVVNKLNFEEDMSSLINELQPFRWKIFQVLPLEGENMGTGSLKDVTDLLITSDQFLSYVERHRRGIPNSAEILKVENNSDMQASYVMIDEYGRFLDSSLGGKTPTDSILEVGIDEAFRQLLRSQGGGYDHEAFIQRGGEYTASWSKTIQDS